MPKEDGYKNLKPFTSANAAQNGRIGGIKSGEVKRERKTMKQALEYILEQASGNVELGTSNMDEILIAMVKKAQQGNVKAAEFCRDTVGDKLAVSENKSMSGHVVVSWMENRDSEEQGLNEAGKRKVEQQSLLSSLTASDNGMEE